MYRKGVLEYSALFAANYSAAGMLPQCRKYLMPQQVASKRNGLLHIRPSGELQKDVFEAADIALYQLTEFVFGA